jgi:ATP-dependent RNA helicase SUPV3L1/SUV3
MRDDELVNGMARGLAFRLVESLGVIPRSVVAKDVKELDQDGRGLLRKHGVRFGQYTLFQQLMLKPAPTRLRLVLWSLFEDLDEFPEAPPPGLVTIPETKGSPKGYYPRAGYRLAGDRAIRIDMLERLADLTRTQNVKDGFEANSDMLSISGTTLDQFSNMMEGLGFSVEKSEREKIKPEPQDGNEVKSAEADEDIMETFYIFRWVPKVRPMRKEHSQKEHNKPKKNKKSENTKFKKQSASSVKKDKPLDPDNPFAALLALKGKS